MTTPDRELTFDRGTLLLRGPWPREVTSLPAVLLDPRVRALRAPAAARGAIVRRLAELRLPFLDRSCQSPTPSGAWNGRELRPYQEEALRAWHAAGARGLVVLPTGAGKTCVAVEAIRRSGVAALCLVPTRVLLEQWRTQLALAYDGPVGCLGDGARKVAPITVATFESAWRHMEVIGDRFDLLIIDEVHHFGAGVRDEALEMAIAASRLGLTATPPSGPAAQRLTELVGPIVYQLGVADLAGEWLAPFDRMVIRLDLSPCERRSYEAEYAKFRAVHEPFRRAVPGATWTEFIGAASATAEGRAALAAWRRVRRLLAFTEAKAERVTRLLAAHRGAKVLVFTADNETAYFLARRELVMPLTCDIGREERDEALGAFRDGRLRALVSARVLNEGLDVPDADVAIVVGGALGKREHVQRVGRLLRPAPGKRALVYELVSRDTIEVHQARKRRESLVT